MKNRLSYYLRLYVIGLITNCKAKTKNGLINEISEIKGTKIIGCLPGGILEYLKKIDG